MKENKKDKRTLNILRTNKKRLMAAVLGLFLLVLDRKSVV